MNMFLEGKIGFTRIAGLVEDVLSKCGGSEPGSLEDAIGNIELGRVRARELAG